MAPSSMMDPAALNAMASSLFTANRLDPKPTTGTINLKGIARLTTIYVLPDTAGAEERKNIAVAFMTMGKSPTTRIPSWQTWVLSLTCLCFPAFTGRFKTANLTEYSLTPFPDTFLDSVSDAVAALQNDPEALPELHIPPGLPTPQDMYTWSYWNCGSADGMFAYYALVVHLMGRQIKDTTRTAITIRRPGNLIDTFKCGAVAYVLTGDGKMSNIAHIAVHDAWSQSDAPRQIFIEDFCRQRSNTDRSVRIVFLMFQLLEYAGMQNATFINALLSACPWVIEDIPMLASSYALYVESILAFAAADQDFRPYLKLYHGNASQIFHSKSLQDLNGVAVEWLKQNVESMKDYTAPGAEKAKAAFAKAAARRGIDLASMTLEPVVLAPVEE